MAERLSRRRFLGLVGLGAGTAVLAACAPSSSPTAAPQPTAASSGGSSAEPTSVPAEAPQNEEKIPLTLAVTSNPEDMEENLQPFKDEHPNYEITVMAIPWEDYDDKVNLMIAAGDAPAVWANLAKRGISYHVERGVAAALDPYIDRDNYSFDGFFKIEPDRNIIDGKRYGIYVSEFPVTMVYNKVLFDEAGVAYPPSTFEDESWTWDEFIARGQALTKPADDPMQTVWGFDGGWDLRYICRWFGTDLWTADDYVTTKPTTSQVTSEQFKWTLQMLQDLIWKYKIEPTPDQQSALAAVAPNGAFVSSKAAMGNAPCWIVGTLKDVEFEFNLAAWPVNQWGGTRGMLYVDPWSMLKTKHQDEAWELLKFMVSEEGMEKSVELSSAGRTGGVTLAGIPSRKQAASMQIDAWAEALQCDRSIVQVWFDAIEYCGVFPSATNNFGEVWDVGMSPVFDQLLMNQITVDEAAAKMDTKINDILAQA